MKGRGYAFAILFLALGMTLTALSINVGSLSKTRSLVRVKCLGCLGMDPYRAGGVEFWTEYPGGYSGGESWREGKLPEHPEWVLRELESKKVVVIFFWGEGCEPCARQWDGMRKRGFVVGGEADGAISPAYAQNVSLHSLDAGLPENGEVYNVYIPPPGDVGVPMTVVLSKVGGDVVWYSRVGYWEPADLIGTVEVFMEGEGGQND